MFFLQMSGVPGAGKSTLARAVSKQTGAIVIDHDIVKSALLCSMGENIDTHVAGKVSYDIEWALVDFHLSQGQSVILDSPCMYPIMLEKGIALSQKYGATYKYVECSIADLIEIDNRLKTRQRLISQNDHVSSAETFKSMFDRSVRPSEHQYLVVDSTCPLDTYLGDILSYLNTRQPN